MIRFPLVFRWQLDLSEQRRADANAMHDRQLAELRERIAEWKAIAIEKSKELHEANSRHFIAQATSEDRHHELAMHPPTGILTGPTLITPMDAFGEKTKEAINAMSAGLSQSSRDAMITAALRLKARNPMWTDEDLSRKVLDGEPHG